MVINDQQANSPDFITVGAKKMQEVMEKKGSIEDCWTRNTT